MADPPPGASEEARFAALAAARGLRPVGRGHLDRSLRGLAAFFARAGLRDEVAARSSPLQGVDPRARLLGLLAFLVSVSLARTLPALLLHALLPLAALALSRIRPRELLGAGLGAAAIFTLLLAAPATLNLVVGGEVLLPLIRLEGPRQLGPLPIPEVIGVSREGLLTAATLLLRVLTSVAAALWVALATPWMDLLAALGTLGLPPIVVQVVGMTVRYLHTLQRQVEEAYLGKRSRTVCRAPQGRERAWVAARMGQVWERSLVLMGEVEEAMTARGFTGTIRAARVPRFGLREWSFVAATLLGCGGAHVL